MDKAGGTDLIAAHWLLAGQRPCADPAPCPIPLRERARLAAEAGYTGIGLLAMELEYEVARHGTHGVAAMLEDAGIRHVELEALSDWWRNDDVWRRSLDRMICLGSAIGARLIKATGDFSPDPPLLIDMREAFSRVAQIAVQGDVPVALEIIAFSNIADVADALEVLGDQAGKGVGLMLDNWHVERGHVAFDEIAALRENVILGVEISDVGSVVIGNLFDDTLDHRRIPGEGRFSFARFFEAVAHAGYRGPIGLEVLSAALRRDKLGEALDRCAQSARKILSERH